MKPFTYQNTSNETLNSLSAFSQLRFEELHLKFNESLNMVAIIVIHSTRLGPALGGCRFRSYPSLENAIHDAMRLAHGMSYKAAMCNLPLGGGKSVIIQTPTMLDRVQIFKTFGQFVHELGGRYIPAEDSGTSVEDMDIIRQVTPFVSGDSSQPFSNKDPSPLTAMGVRRGIEAAVKYHLHRDDLTDIHVAIQGVGHVGYHLAKELHQCGAKLTISDIKPETTVRCADEFHATPVLPNDIHKVDCDVFSPCALSNAVTFQNLNEIKATVIAGSANNQLESSSLAKQLAAKRILYAPDYVINAGGLIYVGAQFSNQNEPIALKHIENIYQTLLMIFERSEKEGKTPLEIADTIAEKRLYAPL